MEYFGGEAMNLNKIFRGAQGNITFSLNLQGQAHTLWGVNSWGGGYSINIYTGKVHPEVQPPYPLIYHFFTKKVPIFMYLLLTNGTSFAYLV